MRAHWVYWPALILLCLFLPISVASGQQNEGQAAPAAISDTELSVDPTREQAEQIKALIEGTLDPSVDPEPLFRMSIAGGNNQMVKTVLEMVEDDDLYRSAQSDPTVLEPLTTGQATLAIQQAQFLRFPESRQRELIDEHNKRAQAAQVEAAKTASQSAKIEELKTELQGLKDFLEGKPTSLTRLDLNLVAYVALTPKDGSEVSSFPEDADMSTQIDWLHAEIARAKAQILSLPPDRLAQLVRLSGVATLGADSIANADAELQRAQAELRDAEQQAKSARDEQARLIASENTALLATRQAQAELRAELARSNADLAPISEAVNTWQIRAERIARDDDDPTAANSTYDELIGELSKARERFRKALQEPDRIPDNRIRPKPIDPLLDISRDEVVDLMARYDELQGEADAISEEYADTVWAKRTSSYDAIGALNASRLTMLPALSSQKRTLVTGFGRPGVAQAGRELDQLLLQGGYYLQSGPRLFSLTGGITPKLVFELFWIVIALAVFRWWRKQGDSILTAAYRKNLKRRSDSLGDMLKLRMIGIWRAVRRPLDWSILLSILWWLWPIEYAGTAFQIVWLIAFWTTCTFVLLSLVNELAKGQTRADPRAELRWRSLRLIGVVTLAIMLLLQTTEALVGAGTIYSWIASIAWIAVPIVTITLAFWWQERINSLAAAEVEANPTSFLTWIAEHQPSIANVLPYAAAGAVLLFKGAVSQIEKQSNRIALVREIGRQKEREEAARQVAADKASGKYHSLPLEQAKFLYPHRNPQRDAEKRSWPSDLVRPTIKAGTITAVVGDRGLGKSTLMRDAAASAKDFDSVIHVAVDARGMTGLLDDLLGQLDIDLPHDEIDPIASAIAAHPGSKIIAIDDIHRLIVPAIGGLLDFDRLTRLVRNIGADSACIATVERASWEFLERARYERLVFDEVVLMPRWPIEDIRELIERRTRQAGIEPDFENVSDGGALTMAGDLTSDQRKRITYFDRLHSYSDGNPAIALEFWRRSLFVDEEQGKVVVLTFARPKAEKLYDLPMPALIVLRAVLQMGQAAGPAIERSTNLPAPTVRGIVRRLQRVGAIQPIDGCYIIALRWWIEANRLLERRNLIIRRSK